MKGWNEGILTKNFRFSPERVIMVNQVGGGGTHLYIALRKIVVCSPWFQLMKQRKGKNAVRVALNANNHEKYKVNRKVVEAVVVVNYVIRLPTMRRSLCFTFKTLDQTVPEAAKARSRSVMRSFADSMPTDKRTRLSLIPKLSRLSGGTEA